MSDSIIRRFGGSEERVCVGNWWWKMLERGVVVVEEALGASYAARGARPPCWVPRFGCGLSEDIG